MTTRYKWEIKTSNKPYSGTGGLVTLSLHGANGITDDLNLSSDYFTKNEVATGKFEAAEELGEITTGNLSAKLDEGRPWSLDYVKITNLDNGDSWIAADVGECTSQGCPLLRFEAIHETATSNVKSPEVGDGESRSDTDDQNIGNNDSDQSVTDGRGKDEEGASADPPVRLADVDALIQSFKKDIEDLQLRGNTKEARICRQIGDAVAPLLRQLCHDSSNRRAAKRRNLPVRQRGPREIVTVEVFGQLDGRNVPISKVLSQRPDGRLVLLQGARIFITSKAGEGLGLAGRPGAAESVGPYRFTDVSRSHDLTFEVVTLDGFAVKQVEIELLHRLFGADWKATVVQEITGG